MSSGPARGRATTSLRRSSRRVVLLDLEPVRLLDLSGPAEAFLEAERLGEGALYRLEIAALRRRQAETLPDRCSDLARLVSDREPIDTLLVCGGEDLGTDEGATPVALKALARRARRVAGVGAGVFALAAAGLLDGRRAAAHWRRREELARRCPNVAVEPDRVYVADRDVWTSAGGTAGIDMALAMIERDHGSALAHAVAQELVMFLRRPGAQPQLSAALEAQGACAPPLRDIVPWIAGHLHEKLTVERLAERVGLSPRQFARVFVRAFGVTPGRLVDRLRVEAAQRRLQTAPRGLSSVAAACGFGGEEAMRRAFIRTLGTPPGAYRDSLRETRSELRA